MASDSEQDVFDDDWEEWNPEATSFLTHTIAGSCAGVMEHVGMFPVDTYKVSQQRAGGPRVAEHRTARGLSSRAG